MKQETFTTLFKRSDVVLLCLVLFEFGGRKYQESRVTHKLEEKNMTTRTRKKTYKNPQNFTKKTIEHTMKNRKFKVIQENQEFLLNH